MNIAMIKIVSSMFSRDVPIPKFLPMPIPMPILVEMPIPMPIPIL